MSDDFVKRGTPTGMSRFAKLGLVLLVCLIIGIGVIGYRTIAAYGAVADATETAWEAIMSGEASADMFALPGWVRTSDLWGAEAQIAVDDSEIWFHQAQSTGTWTGADGMVRTFVMEFLKSDDAWQISGLTVTP